MVVYGYEVPFFSSFEFVNLIKDFDSSNFIIQVFSSSSGSLIDVRIFFFPRAGECRNLDE